MGLMLLKNFSLLFLLLSASLLSPSSADRRSHFRKNLVEEVDEGLLVELSEDESTTVHERLLRVNSKDYGKYDSSPALVKPPFKLIPN